MKCADDRVLLLSVQGGPLWMIVLDFLVQPEGLEVGQAHFLQHGKSQLSFASV